jgi:hypothetical protein
MLRSGSPDLVRQEIAAWAAGTGMTRGVLLDAARAVVPARRGRRAGLTVRPRDLSFARALRVALSAIRLGHGCYQAVTSGIARYRNVTGRGRGTVAWEAQRDRGENTVVVRTGRPGGVYTTAVDSPASGPNGPDELLRGLVA